MARGGKTVATADPLFTLAAGGLPVVVLVGRTNVGKSTLFNRLVGRTRAITSALPGTTRDLNLSRASHDGHEFVVVDTGGLELGGRESLPERIVAAALRAVSVADLVVFMVDGRAGLNRGDEEALSLVRETGRPMLVAVNKIDRPGQQAAAAAADFYALGVARLVLVSAAHGAGVGELLDEIVACLPKAAPAQIKPPDLRLALIGRPNVGKSSLLNRLAAVERSIVDLAPGTTRDTVDIRINAGERDLLLIDTAGVRRPTRVEGELEHRAVARAIDTIRRAEVLALVVDATEGLTDQDARLARLIDANDRALIVVGNKWDLAAKPKRRIPAFVRDAHERYPQLNFAPMVFTSALTGEGVGEIIPAAVAAGDSWRATFQTARLNRILAEATAALDPPLVAGRRLNLMYVTQVKSAPPTLVFFANLERDIPVHYRRFLEGRFRKALGLVGTPLRLEFRRAGASAQRARGAAGKKEEARGAKEEGAGALERRPARQRQGRP